MIEEDGFFGPLIPRGGVIAENGFFGASATPAETFRILTEAGDIITTEAGDRLKTED